MMPPRLVALCGFLFAFAVATAQTVCIDPGHPSEVGSGARGAHVSEIHVAWTVATKMKSILEAQGVKVVLTKTSEKTFVRNRRRAEIANGCHADLMVRLHCDASNDTGFAVYYPDRQGRSQGVLGPEPSVLTATLPLAQRFHVKLAAELTGILKDGGLRSDIKTAVGAKQGALTGSVFSKVPVVLIEMVVLTNPKDESFLLHHDGYNVLARALAAGTLDAIRH